MVRTMSRISSTLVNCELLLLLSLKGDFNSPRPLDVCTLIRLLVVICDFEVTLLHLVFLQLPVAQRAQGFYRRLSLRSSILYLHV